MRHFYNLDMIISVGYRVKSHVATRFRIWATRQLTEFIKKGFLLDDERLKNPDLPFDYFEELERRIQDIRTSVRRFYQKITDIYATSIDYDPTLDSFMTLNDRDILTHAGKISHEIAKQLAEGVYEKFHTNHLTESSQQISDFDKAVKQIESSKKKGGTTDGHK
jgi:hypothetical protein